MTLDFWYDGNGLIGDAGTHAWAKLGVRTAASGAIGMVWIRGRITDSAEGLLPPGRPSRISLRTDDYSAHSPRPASRASACRSLSTSVYFTFGG